MFISNVSIILNCTIKTSSKYKYSLVEEGCKNKREWVKLAWVSSKMRSTSLQEHEDNGVRYSFGMIKI